MFTAFIAASIVTLALAPLFARAMWREAVAERDAQETIDRHRASERAALGMLNPAPVSIPTVATLSAPVPPRPSTLAR